MISGVMIKLRPIRAILPSRKSWFKTVSRISNGAARGGVVKTLSRRDVALQRLYGDGITQRRNDNNETP